MTKELHYGVARGEKLIGDHWSDIATARGHLANIEGNMAQAGLESDVRLVTVEVETKIGRPHVYREPEESAPVEEAPEAIDAPEVQEPAIGSVPAPAEQ